MRAARADIDRVQISWKFLEPTPDPAAYTALLAASYEAIEAARPSMKVVGGALAPRGLYGTGAISGPDFLRAMYAAGRSRSWT